MIIKLCIFTISFAFNRQVMLDFLEKYFPENIELFLFVSKECKGKFHSKRIKIYESNKNKYLCFFELRKFCRKNNIERIYNMGALPQEGCLMAFSSIFTKTKSLCHLVVNPFTAYKTGFNKGAIKAFFEFLLLYPLILMIDKFYIPIEDIYEKARKNFFFAKNKIEYLTIHLRSNFFKPKEKNKCRKNLDLPLKQKIILFVGRIEYEKGSDILLELAKRNKDILFLFIGQVFDENIKKSKAKNIRLLGFRNYKELLNYYNSADLCVFPSRSEAGPAAARESMSCGTQVILPDIMGPRTLCPPAIKSSLELAEINNKIKTFFELPQKEKKKLSKQLRNFVIERYSEEKCKDSYIKKLLN